MNVGLLFFLPCVALLTSCGEIPIHIGMREARASVAVDAATPASHSTAAVPGEGVVFMPVGLPQPHSPDDVVGLRLEGVHPGATGVQEITFGQIFIPGQVPKGSDLAALVNGREWPMQLDVKARNPDGSARMGIITLEASKSGDVLLVKRRATATSEIELGDLARSKYDLAVDILMRGPLREVPYHFDVSALLAKALQAGKASYWLRGPLATEARVDVPVTGSLRLTFDVRAYANGSTYTDVQFNNDIALTGSGGELTYDASIHTGNKTYFHESSIRHFQYQTWHFEVWGSDIPHVNVIHDVAAMARAGAIQNYDLATGVNAKLIVSEIKQLSGPGFGILENSGVTKYMPTTGERGDIGPATLANTIWLMTQNADAAKYALAQADASGSAPWHFWDGETGTYVTLADHPKLWTDQRGGSDGISGLTQPVDQRGSGWVLEGAHQPDLAYVPYLLTGSRYYSDQLSAQASWSLLATWPVMRENGKGIVVGSGPQVRSQAWNLRQLVEAAYAIPDDSPLKNYFDRVVSENFRHILNEIHTAKQGQAYGWKMGDYREPGAIAPWQQSYLASTIVLAAMQGVQGAKEVLIWQSHFLAGRFLAEADGMSPYDATVYSMYTYAKHPDEPYQTWREISEATRSHGQSGSERSQQAFGPYLRASRAVLCGFITVIGSLEARQALNWLDSHSPHYLADIWRQAPTWNIVSGQ